LRHGPRFETGRAEILQECHAGDIDAGSVVEHTSDQCSRRGRPIGRLTRAALFGATILAGTAPAFAAIDDLTADNNGQLPLPTGQYVTPTLVTGANLQFLNPHLANYPDFVAGIASRSAVSPDGRTLLIGTNGYNSLNDATGKTDPAASNHMFSSSTYQAPTRRPRRSPRSCRCRTSTRA